MNARRLIRLYYCFQIFFSLLLWLPIFYEYQKRIGLNDAQIFTIQSVYYTVFCLLEIPTGLVGDWLGFRFCMRLGATVLVAANLLPVFFPDYYSFMAHFFFIALSRSLISGASSAYLYEGLRARGMGHSEYKRVEGNSRSYGLVLKVVLWPLAGYLMQWRLSSPYLLTAAAAAIAVAFSLLLPPDDKPARPKETAFLREMGELLKVFPRVPLIPMLMVQGLTAFILPRILQVNLFQPILGGKGFSVASYGIWMSVMSIFEAAGSSYPAMRFTLRYTSEWNAVTVLSLCLAATLASIPMTGQLGTIASLVIFSLATGMVFPVQKQLMNDAITLSPEASKYRATVLSMESIFDRAFCAWVAAAIGVYLSRGQMNAFLYAASGACAFSVVVLAVFARTKASAVLQTTKTPSA